MSSIAHTLAHPVSGRPSRAVSMIKIFALLDSAAPLGYLLLGEAIAVQVFALALKLLILLALAPAPFNISRTAFVFTATLLAMTFTGAWADALFGTFSFHSLLRYLGFTASLLLTLKVLESSDATIYCRYLVIIPVLVAALHIVLSFTGGVNSHYGRFFYVGNTHPNLGGEISAIAALAAALTLRPSISIPVLGLLLTDCYLMQSRAALVTIGLLAAVVIICWTAQKAGRVSVAALAVYAVLLTAVPHLLGFNLPDFVLQSVLLVDDPARGIASGLVGRDIRWGIGWTLFSENILLGRGLGIFDTQGIPTPHNAFLYGLAQHGLISIVFWTILLVSLKHVWTASYYSGSLISIVLLMLFFNDRFINLNAFPFVLYAIIFSYGARGRARPVNA
jgi:hypothetical protein